MKFIKLFLSNKYWVGLTFLYIAFTANIIFASDPADSLSHFIRDGKSVIIFTAKGLKYRVSPYGNWMIRIHSAKQNEPFLPDDHYEMVEKHNWNGEFQIEETNEQLVLTSDTSDGLHLIFNKFPFSYCFYKGDSVILNEKTGIEYRGNIISESFIPDSAEHFTGLGHGFYGKSESIGLKGKVIERNYGTKHGDQAPLIVPFYMSSNGYGIFLNSTFVNRFSFNNNGEYGFSINSYGSNGQLDYFFIYGPQFKSILNHYTELTGRTFLPPLAFFGLGLSDKGNDHNSEHPSDEVWWKEKITQHRNAGLAIDHIINDNRWRAGGGERCKSYFDWDSTRFPDPAEYEQWVKKNGLIVTLDFNRCIGMLSEDWKPSYNVHGAERIDFGNSAPDFTKKIVRDWFWKLFWNKSLNPKLNYPGDALWIDEFDEYNPIDDTVKLGNGLLWGEMKNYWFFLVAKSLVAEGWNKSFGHSKRPFVWIRGMTAGAQRYATLWTGDIKPTYEVMKEQIISTQLAGLSGFPFEGHDQGGFYDYENKRGPDSAMYQKWSMAFGAFTPFWKPHGIGKSRWPLDRTQAELITAKKFIDLRYSLIPYTYSIAFQAHLNGTPMVRPMIWDYQNNSEAWVHDLQYMWGPNLLVIPNASENDSVNFWLPKGEWFDYWTNQKVIGDRILKYPSSVGSLVLFVKAGSILPITAPALSTAFIDKNNLILKIYPGANGQFKLYEDDGVSGYYLDEKYSSTTFGYDEESGIFTINKTVGTYIGASLKRNYSLFFIDTGQVKSVTLNGETLKNLNKQEGSLKMENGFLIDQKLGRLEVYLRNISVSAPITIKIIQ